METPETASTRPRNPSARSRAAHPGSPSRQHRQPRAGLRPRQTVKAGLFGTGAHVDARQQLAWTVPLQVYDLVTGGVISSALVPVFSEYAAPGRDRRELWRLAGAVLAPGRCRRQRSRGDPDPPEGAPFLVSILSREHNAEAQAQAADLLRLMPAAVVLMSLAGVLTSLLYALKRFSLPAFSTTVFQRRHRPWPRCSHGPVV